MIGGAAINRPYAHRTLFVDEETAYEPGVFYSKDAFEGLELMDTDHPARESAANWSSKRSIRRGGRWKAGPRARSCGPEDAHRCTRSATPMPKTIPTPPFWGVRETTGFRARGHLAAPRSEDALPAPLGRQGCQGRGLGGAAPRTSSSRACAGCRRRRANRLDAAARSATAISRPTADGNDLVIFDPDDPEREIARFAFPRQPPASGSAWPTTSCRSIPGGGMSPSSRS